MSRTFLVRSLIRRDENLIDLLYDNRKKCIICLSRSLWLNITMKEETINVTNVVGWIKGAIEPGKFIDLQCNELQS